ncbi:GNAT family N-acetyltransferase [Actinomadura gamaensis]|uniref:GNAT family N-acetyltransferase n=1 Tax=Actinomadura gamaensis TaxID=1763541 RepID=A0ABV9U364_9ACTN
MTSEYWPLDDLCVRSGSIELRPPLPAEYEALADAAARETHVHPLIPFLEHASDTPMERGRRTLQWLWRNYGTWRPDEWSLALAVLDRGRLVGVQNVRARDFARDRVTQSGVWVFRDERGQGIGKHSRHALLHLIFDGLGAERSRFRAAADNRASLALARSLGYVEDPPPATGRGGARHFSLTADRWRARPHPVPAHIEGLDRALFMFGIGHE